MAVFWMMNPWRQLGKWREKMTTQLLLNQLPGVKTIAYWLSRKGNSMTKKQMPKLLSTFLKHREEYFHLSQGQRKVIATCIKSCEKAREIIPDKYKPEQEERYWELHYEKLTDMYSEYEAIFAMTIFNYFTVLSYPTGEVFEHYQNTAKKTWELNEQGMIDL